jgi:hypothetical protein
MPDMIDDHKRRAGSVLPNSLETVNTFPELPGSLLAVIERSSEVEIARSRQIDWFGYGIEVFDQRLWDNLACQRYLLAPRVERCVRAGNRKELSETSGIQGLRIPGRGESTSAHSSSSGDRLDAREPQCAIGHGR